MNNLNLLDQLLQPAIRAAGYRLVRLRVLGGKRKTLQVMAERPDGGMDVDDCAKLSRKLSDILEAADPFAEQYVLEVSSPGIDRPLIEASDFERFAGHEARVELVHPIDGRRRFKGNIIGVRENALIVETTGETGQQRNELPLTEIAEAKLVLTDRLIQETLKAREARVSKQSDPESHRRH